MPRSSVVSVSFEAHLISNRKLFFLLDCSISCHLTSAAHINSSEFSETRFDFSFFDNILSDSGATVLICLQPIICCVI